MSDLFSVSKALGLHDGTYAIFGSGPLVVRGFKEARDLDVVVLPHIFESFKRQSGWALRHTEQGSEYLDNGSGIELWHDWWPGEWDVAKLIREAELIDGVRFVKLEAVLRWKRLMGREKDIADIAIIEKYLKRQGQ